MKKRLKARALYKDGELTKHVVRRLNDGALRSDIAKELFISEPTVTAMMKHAKIVRYYSAANKTATTTVGIAKLAEDIFVLTINTKAFLLDDGELKRLKEIVEKMLEPKSE